MSRMKKVGTLKALGAAASGLAGMRKRKVKTAGQKAAAARKKKRVTGTPKVTQRRMKRAGLK